MFRIPLIFVFISIELVGLKEEIEKACVNGMYSCHQCEKEEKSVVTFANACANPGTVMVMHFDAGMTVTTVKGARRSNDIACPAFHNTDLLSIDNRNVLFIINVTSRSVSLYVPRTSPHSLA